MLYIIYIGVIKRVDYSSYVDCLEDHTLGVLQIKILGNKKAVYESLTRCFC